MLHYAEALQYEFYENSKISLNGYKLQSVFAVHVV